MMDLEYRRISGDGDRNVSIVREICQQTAFEIDASGENSGLNGEGLAENRQTGQLDEDRGAEMEC